MPFAIECYFDAASDKRVRQLWQLLANAQNADYMIKSGHDPHFSLAIADNEQLDEEKVCSALQQFAAETAPFTVNFSAISVFPGDENVLFLGLTVTEALLRIHRRCHTLLADHITTPRPYYLPDRWVPHCTIGYKLSDSILGACVGLVAELADTLLNQLIQVESLGMIRIPKVHTICRYRLGGQAQQIGE
jgi:2'-5' RNA ligase